MEIQSGPREILVNRTEQKQLEIELEQDLNRCCRVKVFSISLHIPAEQSNGHIGPLEQEESNNKDCDGQ